MRLKIEHVPVDGTTLQCAEFGSVVRTELGGPTLYLVASPYDGSGRRVLVSLGAGTIKEWNQTLRVFPVDATLVVR